MFPVDSSRALCGQGVLTLPGCHSVIVLDIPQVIFVSRRYRGLATVAAVLGWDHSSPDVGKVGTRGTVLVYDFCSACMSPCSIRFRRASSKAIYELSRVCSAHSTVSAVFSDVGNTEKDVDL